MPDNVRLNPGTGGDLTATDEVSYSGDTAQITLVRVVGVSGAEGSKTVNALDAVTLLGRIPPNGQAAMAASMPVVIASDQSVVPVNQAGVSASGAISALNANLTSGAATANSAVELALNGATGFSVDVRGTFTATLVVQVSVTGNHWITVSVLPVGAGLNIAQVASVTAAGAWWGNASGMQQVRVTCSAYTSGTPNVVIRAMQAAGVVFNLPAGQTAQPVSGTVTANIGTGALAAGTNAIGDVGVQYRANATGAASIANVSCPATPAAQAVKAGAGRLLGLVVTNTAASARWVKLWNTAAGSVTLGTTAAIAEFAIPAGQTVNWAADGGIGFSTAITMAVTGGQGLTNNTAVTLGDVTGLVTFA